MLQQHQPPPPHEAVVIIILPESLNEGINEASLLYPDNDQTHKLDNQIIVAPKQLNVPPEKETGNYWLRITEPTRGCYVCF